MTDYCTLAELKSFLGRTDTDDDGVMAIAISAASGMIDNHCRRSFGKSATAEERTYTAKWDDILFTDDIVSISALATDDGTRAYATSWNATDYDLLPENASIFAMPYTWLEPVSGAFPTTKRGVKITGIFGWPAVPSEVKQACLLQASRLLHRKDAPFGVVGSAEMGTLSVIPKLDPDVETLIRGLVRSNQC